MASKLPRKGCPLSATRVESRGWDLPLPLVAPVMNVGDGTHSRCASREMAHLRVFRLNRLRYWQFS